MPAIHLRDLLPGTRFMLCRNGQKFTYMGHGKSPNGPWFAHVVKREFGGYGLTTLHHSCHVKPVVRVVTVI